MKTDYQLAVISRIKTLRESKGISQVSLANVLGISPGQMGNIDSCKQPHKFTIKQILLICDFLNVNIETILFPHETGVQNHSVRDVVTAIIQYQDNSK